VIGEVEKGLIALIMSRLGQKRGGKFLDLRAPGFTQIGIEIRARGADRHDQIILRVLRDRCTTSIRIINHLTRLFGHQRI